MFELPTSITIGNNIYPIRNKGDYKMVLDCFNALNDEVLDSQYRVMTALIIFYEDISDVSEIDKLGDVQEATNKMFEFFNCGTTSIGARQPYKLIDWEKDEQMIASAINSVAGREIRLDPYIHWWTFMGYFNSIGESTLSTVVTIRSKIKKGKQLEKYEKEFKRDNPQYFIWDSSSVADREATDAILSMWDNGG